MALRAIELMRSDATFHELDLDRAEMRVRAGLIGAMGRYRDRSALLDPEAVADWFLASLGPETADTARADALLGLANLSIERVRELRSIKNSLGVVALMVTGDNGSAPVAPPRDEAIEQWLRVRSDLP